MFIKSKQCHQIQGISIRQNINLTHLLFMDDFILFCCCNVIEGEKFVLIIETFCIVARMLVNLE